MIRGMKTNSTKAKLQAGKTVYGTFIRYPDATLVETLAHHDWDFLLFDGEHGTIEPRDCEAMCRAADLLEVTPVVRVPANQAHIILRFMDSGAHACQIPWVNTALEADNATGRVCTSLRRPRPRENAVVPIAIGYKATLIPPSMTRSCPVM